MLFILFFFLFTCFAFFFIFFFFNDTATTEIYTLSLHDALPTWATGRGRSPSACSSPTADTLPLSPPPPPDRKSTRLNSSHVRISYAVFCLKKKKKNQKFIFLKKKKNKKTK